MTASDLPEGWKAGELVFGDAIYSSPPPSSNPSTINLYGWAKGDPQYRIYSIPHNTCISDVVRFFQVGLQSALSYGDDAEETIALVAEKAEAIFALVPSRVTFADKAGLKISFLRQITSEDLEKITALFPEEQMMQAGLERYATDWDGHGSILAPVLEENQFQFWWD